MRRFGYLLLEVTLLLVFAIFAVNVYLERPVLESFLFSMALAVGLTPQLLPAIISVNLSHGAKRMAERRVVVKRLASIENFGSMNVLCSDKTGTLTEGSMRLQAALNVDGESSERVLFLGYLNAVFETDFRIRWMRRYGDIEVFELAGYCKLEEEPYDFVRKRLDSGRHSGDAPVDHQRGGRQHAGGVSPCGERDGALVPIEHHRRSVREQVRVLSGQGFRTIGLACRDMGRLEHVSKEHETGMTFLGLLVFADPPKTGIAETVGHSGGLAWR